MELVERLRSQGHVSTEPLPAQLQTEAASYVWTHLSRERRRVMQEYGALLMDDYIAGVKALPFSDETAIPTKPALDCVLARHGWSMIWNVSLCDDDFFALLANKVFPVTVYVRDPGELDRSRIPDFVHDMWGHLPMLGNLVLSDMIVDAAAHYIRHGWNANDEILNAWMAANLAKSNAGQPVDDTLDVKILAVGPKRIVSRYFLFTIEFGLLCTLAGIKVYGGGILSSTREMANIRSDTANILPLNVEAIHQNEFTPYDKQRNYFFVPDLNMARELLLELMMEHAQ